MNANQTINKRQLRMIRRKLHGRYKEIAEKHKVSKATVSYVLNGIFTNEQVLSTAIEMYNEINEAV